MQAPTPFSFEKPNENENKINEEKLNFELKKEVLSDKNNKFLLFLNSSNYSELCIKAIKDDLIQRIFSNKFSVSVIKKNKYFIQFDDLKEICEEISERVEKEKITLIEETNSVIISIPLPSSKIKEIVFELKEDEKSDKEIIKELMKLINEQKIEMSNLKNEISNLKNELNELNDFKKEASFLFKNYIRNLDSIIIDNNLYNSILKNWINPKDKIKANLLYRLSRDGPEISTYHNLCDNKGATLTLIHVKGIGYKIGYFVNFSFDSVSEWKEDNNAFLFNLNQNKKYKKNTSYSNPAFCCKKDCGPSASCLGCNTNIKLNFLYHTKAHIDRYYINASNILPSKDKKEDEVEYEIEDMEIFQIIIG